MYLSSRTHAVRSWCAACRSHGKIGPRIRTAFTTSIRRQSALDRIALPHLIAERSTGTYDILEEDLCKYTRNRWIYNESAQQSKRYLKFDLQQLLKAAVRAVSVNGAKHCTKVLKCREGLNNKAYLLTMDNGSEVFAKLPNPIAGPAYYTTASEVATRAFLRDVLNIPSPRIIAWSADQNNPVGAEYILEEKSQGVPLGSVWYKWPMKSRFQTISRIVKMERQLASTKFTKSGCIYFKGDISEAMSSNIECESCPPLAPSAVGKFTLGPLLSSGLWRDDRANMEMNRGPYNEPLEFIEAIAKNEMRYIKSYAHPRMNYHRSSTDHELPEEVLELLERYIKLTPAMVPPNGETDTHSPSLWHPDLHLDNVFVDPKSMQITNIIDWQSANVMPLFYQRGIPRMFQHPGTVAGSWTLSELPENYDNLDQSEKAKIDSDRKSEACQLYYIAETKGQNPRHWAALHLKDANQRIKPSQLIMNVWEDHDVFFLRRALIEIVQCWQDLCPELGPCPVSFSEQELALHAAEEESMSNVGEILRLFKESWGLPSNGLVDPDDFEKVQAAVAELKESFIQSADNEAERKLFARLWPYTDVDS